MVYWSEVDGLGNPTGLTIAGWKAVIMKDEYEDYGETARRIVRHGFAKKYKDFSRWAGPIGPPPNSKNIYFATDQNVMYINKDTLNRLNRLVEIGVKLDMPHCNTLWPSQNMYPKNPGGIDVFSV